jgi:hypothetical protein
MRPVDGSATARFSNGEGRMISLRPPSLALNSFDVPNYEYHMTTTWKMPRRASIRDVLYWIGYACDRSPDQELKHVVLHNHGSDGCLYIGKNESDNYLTIDSSNVDLFAGVRNRQIGTIWIHGCEIAKTDSGRGFMRRMAVAAGCDVVAADSIQYGWWTPFGVLFMPRGNIDDFEGTVYRASASGNVEKFYPNGNDY